MAKLVSLRELKNQMANNSASSAVKKYFNALALKHQRNPNTLVDPYNLPALNIALAGGAESKECTVTVSRKDANSQWTVKGSVTCKDITPQTGTQSDASKTDTKTASESTPGN